MLVFSALTAGCVRSVRVPIRLPVQPDLPIDALVTRVNEWSGIERVQATVTLQFRDLRQAGEGKNKEYPAADGILVLSRPEMIRLQIRAPFVGKRIADMVSDGQGFRVKVLYPEDKRKFIIGSNEGRYKRIEADTTTEDPALQQAGALANIRPQHLTDAFLLRPLMLDVSERGVYFLDQNQQIERARVGGKNREIVRTHYVLTMLERIGDGPEAYVVRRLWFDRTREGTPLAQQELYENGRLATIVRYHGFVRAESGRFWPERVSIERVDDDYSVEVIFEPKALTLNGELPEQVFTLENEENLEEIDLDKRTDIMQPGAASRR